MKRTLLISMICLIFATSCIAKQETACMAPVVNFDFPVNNPESINLFQDGILPLGNWQKQNSNDQNIQSIELVQQEDGRDFIWVSVYSEEGRRSSLLRFQPDEKAWEPVKNDDLPLGNFSLIKDTNGGIWYTRKNWTELKPYDDLDSLMIGVYEKKGHQFRAALKVRDLLAGQELNSIDSIYLADAKFDSENNLWFILYQQIKPQGDEYRLLKYSQTSGKIEQKLTNLSLDGNYGPGSLAISGNDKLYLVNAKDELLIRYDLQKDSFETINIPANILDDGLTGPIPLFLNGNDKLWLTDYGWADMSSPQAITWHKIVRSPALIYQQMGNGIMTWAHPRFLMESEDQRLWYTSGRGSGWVDPGTGQWCVFTSYPSNIVEDSDQNLWMSAAGNLYKYNFEE